MIAFRRNHPSLSRSRFWREDVSWYGVGPTVDLSHDSHSLAFCLHGASQADDDIYAMINAYWEELEFNVQEGNSTGVEENRGHRFAPVQMISWTTESL